MTIPNSTYRVLVEKLGAQDASTFVGNEGEVFYNPNSPILKLSDGSTPGGVSIGGTGGSANTGNITFSAERIIGETNGNFPNGVIQLTPLLNTEGIGNFVDDGQYVNVYPTTGADAPHIHIAAGTLSTTSPYYNEVNGYYYGDIFLGNDNNYVSVKGDGRIEMYSNPTNGLISFEGGNTTDGKIRLYQNGNTIDVRSNGLNFDNGFAVAQPEINYVGFNATSIIYSSKVYGNQCGSMKLLVQCQGDSNTCQLSELLIVRPFGGTSVYMKETGRVTGIGTTAHITFSASYNVGTDQIEVFANTTTDPNNDQWSIRVVPIEIKQYRD